MKQWAAAKTAAATAAAEGQHSQASMHKRCVIRSGDHSSVLACIEYSPPPPHPTHGAYLLHGQSLTPTHA